MTGQSATNEEHKRVAVIGAGASGLVAAKYLLESNHEVTVFEQGSQIGGLWVYENDSGTSPAYRTLRINTARNITSFTDYPFGEDVPLFPSHWDMHRYLQSYARHFAINDHIRFNCPVTSIEPEFEVGAEPPRWRVATPSGDSEIFHAVIVATGHLSVPSHVPAFRENFEGTYLHSMEYREPADFAGKRVCVVGTGNSAMDIVADICTVAEKTTLVARSGVRIAPKLIMGRPFTDFTLPLFRRWIPARISELIVQALIYIMHGNLERFGFRPVTERVHVTSNPTVVQQVAFGRIRVKHEIEEIIGKQIRFSDGSESQFDVLIGATGYQVSLPFIDESIVSVADNSVPLYKRIVPPDWPGLFFVGLLNSNSALNQLFERQARWIVSLLNDQALLPDPSIMKQDLERKAAWVKRRYKNTPRHKVQEEQLPYISELRRSNRLMKLSMKWHRLRRRRQRHIPYWYTHRRRA